MTECARCGDVLTVDMEWRLRPDVEPGKLETEYEQDYDNWYMHVECYKDAKQDD